MRMNWTALGVALSAVLLLSLLSRRVAAAQVWGNEDLYYALDRADLIVTGRIDEFKFDEPMAVDDYGLTFTLTVGQVLWGEEGRAGERIEFWHKPFIWPKETVAEAPGTECILLLRGGQGTGSWISAVAPGGRAPTTPLRSREAVRRYLVAELLGEVGREKDPGRRREIILQARPLLMKPEEVAPLAPLLEEKDALLRRAALAALVDVAREPRYIDLAVQDLRAEARKSGNKTGAVQRDYRFLGKWNSKPDDRRAELRPLFRTVAEELTDPTSKDDRHVSYGLLPLCREWGTKDDLQLLWRFRDHPEPVYRQAVLMGVSRILGLDLRRWDPNDFPEHEDEQREQVEAALKQAGVFPARAG